MSVGLSPDRTAQQLDRLVVLDELDRGELAARLHDGPIQDLLATRYLIDLALSAAAKGADAATLALRLQSIRDAAVSALTGSRALLGELTARSIDGRNLTGALHSVSETVTTGDAFSGELPPVPPAVAVVVHRLVRALHSSLTSTPDGQSPVGVLVSVSVYHTGEGISVTCDPAPDLQASPLAGWLERAELLGATVSTINGPVAVIHFPLRPAPEGT